MRLQCFEDSFNNRHNIRTSNLEEKEAPSTLKDGLSSIISPSLFTQFAPGLLDRSNESMLLFPSSKSTSCFLPYFILSNRSDLNSEANSSCCPTSDA